MKTFQLSNSVEFATVLLDALDRADMDMLSCHLADSECLSPVEDASSLEGERRDLLHGITASLSRFLSQEMPNASAVDEMDTSVQLLRHLVRMEGRQTVC
jgi:hypothetical protein